ncbi:MAG TPA: hypothetical protein VGE52_07540, partial [Pirellulales bacterium]
WCGVGAEQRNCLTMHLHRHAPDDFRRWSDFVGAARAAYKPVVERKLAALSGVLGNETFAAVWMDVNRCVLGACMERLYAAAAPPIFFGKLMPWYLAGRFPCGWGERRSDGAVQRLGPRDEAEFERFESNPATRLLAEHARFVDPHLRLPAFGRLIVY